VFTTFDVNQKFQSNLIWEMNMNKKALKNVGTLLVLVTLFSVVFVSLPTEKAMAQMAISVSPQSGVV